MTKYKLYLFDLDGTLLDSDQMLIETFRDLYKIYKPKDYVIDEKKIITFSGPPIRETLQKEFPEYDQEMMLVQQDQEIPEKAPWPNHHRPAYRTSKPFCMYGDDEPLY